MNFIDVEERFWFLFTRFLSNESSLEENGELKDIISGDKKYKKIFERSSVFWNGRKKDTHPVFDKDKIKKRVFDNIKSEELQPESKSISYWKYAAVITLIFSLAYYFYFELTKSEPPLEPQIITKVAPSSHHSSFTLVDGTEVWLRENSSISYSEDLVVDGKRKVHLVGEAYFNVAENEEVPFIVETGEVLTRVVGTTFNVRAFPEKDIEVTVESGKVLVENKFKGVVLEPNEQALIVNNSDDISKNEIDSDLITVWKNEFIEFDLISLDKAFFILERYYNVSIDVNRNAIRHCMVRSRYENENLETVLIGLQLIFEFDYEFINDNKILIKNTRCST